jgi:hypothetical protein
VACLHQQVVQVFREIKPEHVAELHYRDCRDISMEGPGDNNAVYIVLKPSVVYKFGQPSYVPDSAAPRPPIAATTPTTSILAQPTLASFRPRLVGVLDMDCGLPVGDVAVTISPASTLSITIVVERRHE